MATGERSDNPRTRPEPTPPDTPEWVADPDGHDRRPSDGSAPRAPAPDVVLLGGEYDAYSKRAAPETMRFDGKRVTRLVVTFEIRGGPHDGEEQRLYLPLPERRNGSFTRRPGPKSTYYRAWVVANRGRPPLRGQAMTFDVFEHGLFRIRVRVVDTDRRQRVMPPCNRYSVVDAILERFA